MLEPTRLQSPTEKKPESMQMASPIAPANLSNDVREIIRPRCGSCHTSTLSTAKPKAVKVFDLAQENWAGTMSSQQLDKFLSRLNSLPESERSKVSKFVEQKKAKNVSDVN